MTPYEILGVKASTPRTEVKSRYKELARLHHPDLGGDEETMKRINAAYEQILSYLEPRRCCACYNPYEDSYVRVKKPKPSTIIIDLVIRTQKAYGFKPGWVVYEVSREAKHLTLELSDFEYIAKKLGYKPMWAEIKYHHYQKNKC